MANEHAEETDDEKLRRRTLLKTLPVSTISGMGFATGTAAAQNNPIDVYLQTVQELEGLGEGPGELEPEQWYQEVQSRIRTLREVGDTLIEQGYQMQVQVVEDEFQVQIIGPNETISQRNSLATTPSPALSERNSVRWSGMDHAQSAVRPVSHHSAAVPSPVNRTMEPTALYLVTFSPPTILMLSIVGLLMFYPSAGLTIANGAVHLLGILGGMFPSVPAILHALYAAAPYVFLLFISSQARMELAREIGCHLGGEILGRIEEQEDLVAIAQIIGDLAGGCNVDLQDISDYAQDRFGGFPAPVPDIGDETGDDSGGTGDATVDVTISNTNAPVNAGEALQLVASVQNTGGSETTQSIQLIVGHSPEQVDSQTVTLAPDEAQTVTLGYETYPAAQTTTFPVRVESEDDAAEQSITVYGTEDSRRTEDSAAVAVTIQGTNAPLNAGEQFQLTATAQNTGNTEVSETVRLIVGHSPEQVDSQTVTLAPSEAQTVTLGYETYPAEQTTEFPVRVESGADTAEQSITVYGTG